MKSCLVLTLVWSGAGLAQICAPTGVVQPNAQITSTLDASDCALSDGTWFADYLVDFPSRGKWSASVTPADGVTAFTAILRDASGAMIYSGANITGNVERGTYHLLVNSPAPNQGGAFTFNSSFSATSNILCQQFAMMGTIRAVNGSLGPGSCTLPDGSISDGYQLTLYGTGTIDIAVTPIGFTPLLILRTSDGYSVAGTNAIDASGNFHLVVPEVGNDTYTVVVAVSSADQTGGTYSATATFTPDMGETCVSQATLNTSTQYNGSISIGSCNFNPPGRDDGALFNYHNIHLDSAGSVQASIDSSDFSPLLLLLDANGNPINQDVQSGGSGMPLLSQQLEAGDYLLMVFNEDSFGGNYTLDYQYTPGPAPSCPVITMNPGDQPAGTLAGASSCKDGIYMADAYQIVLPADGTVNLLLASPDFSAFLDLHDNKDNDLTWGVQSSDGSTSSIAADLPAGTYYVDAASMDLPGGYSLSYTFTPKTLQGCPAPTQMLDNEYIQNAQVGPASCEGPDGRDADSYTFTLSAPATEALIMTSGSVSPDLRLYRSDGTPLRRDQNSYADDNALIVQYLPAGNYLVKARSADPTESGSYNLYLLVAPGGPPQLCAPLTLSPTGSVSGQTSFTSCTWYDKTFADVYQLTVADSTQVVAIGAQSTDFDSYLELLDSKGNVMSTDDNSGGGLNPLVVQSLDPGTYYVVVKPANDPTSAGNYVLTTASSPASMIRRRQPN